MRKRVTTLVPRKMPEPRGLLVYSDSECLRVQKCVAALRQVAQTLRNQPSAVLCQVQVAPKDVLRQIVCALAEYGLMHEAYDVINLREATQQETGEEGDAVQLNVGEEVSLKSIATNGAA